MGLFQHKQQTSGASHSKATGDSVDQVLDEQTRDALRAQAKLYFERVINENAALFKQDLDATVAHINTELRQHVARQLDEQFVEIDKVNTELKEHVIKEIDDQFAEYSKTMEDAHGLTLDALNRSAQALQEQHHQLSQTLQKSVADQDTKLTAAFKENNAQLAAMQAAQDTALQSLSRSAQALQAQSQQLGAQLQQHIAAQEAALVGVFEQNMARIIEHYLLEALGDQYDLKAQLPAIIKQMEANKQDIVEDMKL